MDREQAERIYFSKEEEELATGSIPKLFRKYTIPSVIGLLFLGVQAIIDGVVLGNYVGANALASVNLILPSYTFIISVAVIIGVGCQSISSICLGEQNVNGVNNAMTSAFYSLISFSLIMGMLAYIFAPEIALLMGANDTLLPGSVAYMRSLFPFAPFLSAFFFADYMLKAMGRNIYSMVIMSCTVLLNVVLDILLVGYLHMDCGGAGLSTGIAFAFGTLMTMPLLFNKKKIMNIQSGQFKIKLVRDMFYNGSSEGMSELSFGVCATLFNLTMMKHLGANGVAAFTAINYISFLGITIFVGISDGVIPTIGFNYGAHQRDRITAILRLAVKTNVTIGLCLFLTLFLFGEQIISLFFRSGEHEVIRIATHGSSIFAVSFLLNGLNILASSYFTAIANARTSIIISLLRGLVFVSAGIFVLPIIIGIEGIWLAVPIAEFCTLIVSFFLVRQSFANITYKPQFKNE